MTKTNCCVVNCKNNNNNCKYDFYTFPGNKKADQREKWIAAIKRVK